MRIAIVTETFVPATDGICTRLSKFVVNFKKLGHEVIVISPELGIDNYKGVPVFGLETFIFPLYGSRPWGLPSKKVKDILSDFNPDIVHVVNPISLGTSGVKYANRLEIPLLASYHTHMPKYLDYYHLPLLKPLFWEYIRYWYNKADLNITVSESLMAELNHQSVDTYGVLPRGIDFEQRNPKYFDQELYDKLTFNDPNNKLLVYVGRLAAEKDLHHLRPLLDAHDNICLAFVGDGPDRASLESLFAGTKTTFVGFKHGYELSIAFATGDAFIFPSTSETFGLVISEALASGLPVIAAYNEPTMEQIIINETGVVYESGNTESLLEAVKILDNPLLLKHMQLQAPKSVAKYSWENATCELLSYYEDTIEIHQKKHKKLQRQA